MKSWVAKTEEIDVLEDAIDELEEQISHMQLKKNTIGIAYYYFGTDLDEFVQLINERIDFPVVGVSTMALLEKEGFLDYGIELLVLSDDEVSFEVGITNELNDDNLENELESLYSKMKASHNNEKENLILTYIGKINGSSGDGYVRTLDRISGGVPVYGGIASDLFSYNDFSIFCKDSIRKRAEILIFIYGGIKPILIAESSVSNVRTIGEPVSEAEGIAIYKLGDKTFMNVLSEESISDEEENDNVAMEYMQTPFVMEIPIGEDDSVEVLRNLIYLNKKDGSARFLGDIAKGASIRVSSIRSEDIGKSVKEAFSRLLSKMEGVDDYEYSTIICTSCTGRYINLMGDKNIEGNAYKDMISDNISIVGMYSYGEICPKKGQKTDNYYNIFHNETFTILAI